MDFPFQIGVHDQQTQKEKDHIKEFYEGEDAPIVEHNYVNKDGEKRHVLRVFLPKGCITRETRYFQDKRGTFYFTPLASEEEFLGRVIYEEDGKQKECDSKEWLKWARGTEIKPDPHPAPAPLEGVAGMMRMMEQTAGESELSKGAQWEKVSQRKMTPKNKKKS